MAGNKVGGAKAAATNKAKYGREFYQRIGAMGGSVPREHRGFQDTELASRAGKIGGTISRRGKAKQDFWGKEDQRPNWVDKLRSNK